MKKATTLGKVLLVCAAATGLALLASTYAPKGQKPPAAAPPAQPSDADELAALKEDIRSLRQELSARARRVDPPAPAEERPQAAAEPQRSQPPSGAEIFRALDEHLKREGKEQAWSEPAEASIRSVFRTDTLPGSSLLRADCATTLCRVEVSHDDPLAQQQFLQTVRTLPPFDQEGIARRVDDGEPGTSKTVVYVAREGYALPSFGDGHALM